MPDSNYLLTLLTAAQAYLALGYSVIPLHGDGDRAKIAAIQWSNYQHTRPTESALHEWFTVQSFQALGIVTGRISRLVVLDFDTPELFQRFRHQHPDLSQQHVIQTRRGFHIYFHLPPNLTVQSRKGQGVDLLSDGCYVVGRPSIINDHTYQLIRVGQPKLLTLSDIQQIRLFLQNHAITLAETPPKPQFDPFSRDCGAIQSTSSSLYTPIITSKDLITSYSYYAQQLGRNEALFRASLKARDGGWSVEETVKWLAEVHIQQPPARQHAAENLGQRKAEAIRTIHSAFSHPARPPRPRQVSLHLPNSVREALLRQKRTDVVRTLEGLLMKGIQPGQLITVAEAVTLLGGIVGRDSIHQAFRAQSSAGQPIFEQKPPSALPLAPNGAATDKNPETTKKCFIGGEKNPGKIQSGRKKRVFIMPSNLDLCHKLGVKLSGSDPIMLDDLTTAKQTRMALHRELIKRRPGIYPRRWLARRVGVCTKTLDAYNRDIPINVKHLYLETRISWSNLNHVPDNIQIDGTFIENGEGKRYPPKRQIAAILLSKGHSLTYKRQDANYYWYGEKPLNLSVLLGVHPRQPEMDVRIAAIQAFTRTAKQSVASTNALPQSPAFTEKEWRVTSFPVPPLRLKKVNKRCYQKPFKDQTSEALAEQVYTYINRLALNPSSHISRANARDLIDNYGQVAVERALQIVTTRKQVSQPAALLVTLLRSESKFLP